MIRIEIRVRMVQGGGVRRHLVHVGNERALCGVLTLRAPAESERWAPRCERCERNLAALEARS